MKNTCSVTNKNAGRTVYLIRDEGIRRTFYPGETKRDIPVSELEKLVQQPGGLSLLYNRLFINDPEVVAHLINGDPVPEYWLTEDKIPSWMQSCSLEEFQDALDFAPEGTKDLIKQYAVSLPLNDYSKRQAIKDQLGYDVTAMINNKGEENEAKSAEVSNKTGERRTISSITISQEKPAEEEKIVITAD